MQKAEDNYENEHIIKPHLHDLYTKREGWTDVEKMRKFSECGTCGSKDKITKFKMTEQR